MLTAWTRRTTYLVGGPMRAHHSVSANLQPAYCVDSFHKPKPTTSRSRAEFSIDPRSSLPSRSEFTAARRCNASDSILSQSKRFLSLVGRVTPTPCFRCSSERRSARLSSPCPPNRETTISRRLGNFWTVSTDKSVFLGRVDLRHHFVTAVHDFAE